MGTVNGPIDVGVLRVHRARPAPGAPEPRALEHAAVRWVDAAEVPRNIVTMNSTVWFRDLDSEEIERYTLATGETAVAGFVRPDRGDIRIGDVLVSGGGRHLPRTIRAGAADRRTAGHPEKIRTLIVARAL